MDASTLVRIALVGTLVTVLVSLLVLHGAGWVLADPEQRAAGDELRDEIAFAGTVVSEDPVTLDLDGGERFVLEDADPSTVEEGERVELAVTLQDVGAETADIAQKPWEVTFMYAVSFFAGLVVVGRVLDSWRVDLGRFSVEPREQPLHGRLGERVRTRVGDRRADDEFGTTESGGGGGGSRG